LKVLLDTCVWGGVRKALSDAGHDVVWAGDWTTDPGDEEILHRAHQETRVLVTLDKDFGELAAGAIITVEAARVRVRPPTDSA